jgi:hypothetical protein
MENDFTVGTPMDTLRQGFLNDMSAPMASLGCIPGGHFVHSLISLYHFTREQIKEHTPGYIRDAFGKVSISNHALNIQIFDIDILKVFYIVVGGLMEKILSLIGYFLVCFGSQYSSVISISRAFLSTTQTPLLSSQELFGLSEKLRILYNNPIGIYKEALNANINTNFSICLRQLFGWHVIARERNIPITCRFSTDSYGFDSAFNRSAKVHLESTYILDIEIPSRELPASVFEREGIIPTLSLESWKAWLFTTLASSKESLKRSIEPFQYILKDLRAYSFKLRKFCFKGRELINLVIAGNGLLALIVNKSPLLKSKVVKTPAKLKPLISFSFSRLIYFRFVLVAFSHCFKYLSTARLINSATDKPVVFASMCNLLIWESVR